MFLWSFSAKLWYIQVYDLLYREFFHRDFGRTGRMVYREHLARVKGLTAERGRKLLVWDVKEWWAPICMFLGKPVPQEHFPHGNTGAHSNERLARVVLDEQVRAKWYMLLCFLGVMTFVFNILLGVPNFSGK